MKSRTTGTPISARDSRLEAIRTGQNA